MRRWLSSFMVVLMILVMLPGTSLAVVAPYLQVHFDQDTYTPGDTASVTVMIYGYPAGLDSVAVEMHYNTAVFDAPVAGADFLSGGLMEGASYVPVSEPGAIAVNLALGSLSGTDADTVGGAKLFTLQFPVRMTAPDTYDGYVMFAPVTGLVDDGVRLADTNDDEIFEGTHVDGQASVWMGGTITGQIGLRNRVSQDFSGTEVMVYSETGESAVTDASGYFTIPNMTVGFHDLRISRPGYLSAEVYGVAVVRGGVADISPLGVSLHPGNVKDVAGLSEDTVFLEDLSALARAIGSTSGDGNTVTAFGTLWNSAADLDGNDVIGAADLGLMAGNWGASGASGAGRQLEGTYFVMDTVTADSTLSVSATPGTVEQYGMVQLQATLSNASGLSVAYKIIEFELDGYYLSAATDASGVATVTTHAYGSTGTATFTAYFDGDPSLNGATATGTFTVTAYDNPPIIYSVSNQFGQVGIQMDNSVLYYVGAEELDGDGMTFSATGFPPGISFSASGAFTGTPTSPGTYTVIVTVTDTTPGGPDGDTDSTTFTWTVTAATVVDTTPTITQFGAQTGVVGDAITLTAVGHDDDNDTLTYSAPNNASYSLPPGITIDATSGVISGTLTQAGVYNAAVSVYDNTEGGTSGDYAHSMFTWTVTNP